MDFFTGTILAWPLSYAPEGWLLCQGQLLAVSQYAALYSLLGTVYGGNGSTTFGLPNLQGRLILGVGTGTGLSARVLGEIAGTETATVSLANLPAHTHPATFTPTGGASGPISATLQASSATGSTSSPAGNYIANAFYPGEATASTDPATCNTFVDKAHSGTLTNIAGLSVTGGGGITGGSVAVGATGGGVPVGIMPPFLALNFIICIEGIYPVRP